MAVVFWVSWTSGSILKVTRALSFWTISTLLIAPMDTPAIRTSSPFATPVTSVKTALYSSFAPNPPLLKRQGQDDRGHAGERHEHHQLDEG